MSAGYGSARVFTPRPKLGPPHPEAGVVERPRLTEILSNGFDNAARRVTVLSAPAGYGKTTLLAQWAHTLASEGTMVAWCTLDSDDRDPEVLWSTTRDALQLASDGREILRSELTRLEAGKNPRHHRAFVARLVAALDDYAQPLAIVFDDAHKIAGSPSEEEFARLITLMPGNVRIAIATRSPLLAHRARVNGTLLELTTDTLSFTPTETRTLFAENALDNVGIDALNVALDGWPAALNLAVMNVERTTVPRSLEDIIHPDLLYKYLEHEVFASFTEAQQSVLLAGALCPEITVDLVDAIHESFESGEPLRALASDRAVLYRLKTDPHGRAWYRVRPVLAGFLKEKLRALPAARRRGMVDRAARWHLRHAYPLIAVQLAAEHEYPELLEEVLRQAGYDLVLAGHADSVLALTSPSASQPESGPFTRLMVAYAEAAVGEFDRAIDLITSTSPTNLTPDELVEWDWLRYIIQLRIAQSRDDPAGHLRSGRADDTLVGLPVSLRALVHLSRGLAAVSAGEPTSARRGLLQSLAVGENKGDLPLQILSEIGLAEAAMLEVDVRATLAHAEVALELASDSLPEDNQAAAALAHSLVSWSLLQLLQTSEAQDHADVALRLADHQPNADLRMQLTHLHDVVCFGTLNDRRRVAQEFATMWPPLYARAAPVPIAVASLHSGMAMVAEVGEHRWGEQLLERARPLLGEGHDWQVAHALHLYVAGKPGARAAVAHLLQDEPLHDEPPQVALSQIVERSLEAVLEFEAKNPFRAHSAMMKALETAELTGSYLSVTRPGRLVGEVLFAGLGRFGELERVARTVATHYGAGPGMVQTEALTPRERELLKELTTLRTVEEISHDLLLSVNTVKTHLRGIYRKLNATSRRQAVAAAERAGLL